MNGEHQNTREAPTTDPVSLIKALVDRLRARGDNAYCDMIGVARRDESLGWEIKVERGKFGRPELDAHVKGGELLGRHRALYEAAALVEEELKELLT